MKRCDLTKGLVLFLTIIITLCCGLIPSSWALDDNVDYNKIFKGKYVYSQAGSILVAGHVKSQFGAAGYIYADGKGNSYGEEIVRLDGNTIKATFDGTYKFDGCMGTADITVVVVSSTDPNTPTPLDMKLALVLSKDGNTFHVLTTEIVNNNEPPNDYSMEPFAVVGFGSRNTD